MLKGISLFVSNRNTKKMSQNKNLPIFSFAFKHNCMWTFLFMIQMVIRNIMINTGLLLALILFDYNCFISPQNEHLPIYSPAFLFLYFAPARKWVSHTFVILSPFNMALNTTDGDGAKKKKLKPWLQFYFLFFFLLLIFYYYSKGCSADEVLYSSTAGVYRNNGLTGILGPRWFWFGRRLCAFRSFIISREVKLTMKTMLHFQTAGHPQIDHWSCQAKDRRFSTWGIHFIIKGKLLKWNTLIKNWTGNAFTEYSPLDFISAFCYTSTF